MNRFATALFAALAFLVPSPGGMPAASAADLPGYV